MPGVGAKAASCQEVSPTAGAGLVAVRKVPAPGRDSTSPRWVNNASAWETVVALTSNRRTSSRCVGIREPAGRGSISVARVAASSTELLLSFMSSNSSAIAPTSVSPLVGGTALAGLGVLSFSLSFPATVAALGGFGPWTTSGLRGVLAAALAATALLAFRVPLPQRRDWPGLAVVSLGCVLGFPLLTALALQTSSTAHSAVVIGALPMATATIAALRTGRHPSPVFWAAAGAGGAIVVAFALTQSHGRPTLADLYLLIALLGCAAGYAEGGRLSAHLPSWTVIAWAVVLGAPLNLLISGVALAHEPVHVTFTALLGLIYIAAISQFGGFVLWYRGMSLIGVAKASQLQLAQPLLTLVWAVLLLGEHLTPAVPLTALAVLACIVVTQRARAA